jgi:hypothetical protein
MGEVIELFHDQMRHKVISVGSDGLIKVWNLDNISVDEPPIISCIYSQVIQYDSSCPPSFAISKNTGKVAVSYFGSLTILDYINHKCKYYAEMNHRFYS